MKILGVIVTALLAWIFLFGVPEYNHLQKLDENTTAAWSEVLNQYQSRAELIPNLVATVKGYAQHEEKVFTEVTNARAKVGSLQINADSIPDEATLKQFNQAQGELSSALSRLLVVSENYPQLKADKNFLELQAQLEGRENRVNLARNRYIEAVKQFNVAVRSFPSNMIAKFAGLSKKPNFSVENEKEISQPPKVEF